jgi:hypothetical protein
LVSRKKFWGRLSPPPFFAWLAYFFFFFAAFFAFFLVAIFYSPFEATLSRAH